MNREWKPGDVAFIPGIGRAIATGVGDCSLVARDRDPERRLGHFNGVRPLVVIDAEDREAVKRLYGAIFSAYREPHVDPVEDHDVECMQAALREYANPTPPRPDEPQGLGAVVEDEQGLRWSLLPPTVNGKRWACWDEPKLDRDYADIAAVRVLSEGVSA